jgi:hypothetical protein
VGAVRTGALSDMVFDNACGMQDDPESEARKIFTS